MHQLYAFFDYTILFCYELLLYSESNSYGIFNLFYLSSRGTLLKVLVIYVYSSTITSGWNYTFFSTVDFSSLLPFIHDLLFLLVTDKFNIKLIL